MTNDLFSYVKKQIDILSVIQDFTTLKRAGTYWKGKCPFHHERTGSFTVSPHKEIFYCFGCQANGDVISFIMKIEHCSSKEAIEYLIKKYQIAVPQNIIITNGQYTEKKSTLHHTIYTIFIKWCQDQLIEHPSIQKYLYKRGFIDTILTNFKVGYFPPQSINTLLTLLRKNQILADDLIETKIVSLGKANHLYSPFEDRIIFPIFDHLSRPVGFGGRIVHESTDQSRPKYYNSPESDYFLKGSLLFGLDKAKKTIQATGCAFLVEGYTDCLAMVQNGYQNTIATLGTACTINHLRTLSRYAQQLFVLYDGDRAGNDAVMRLTQLCWQADLELKVVSLPANQDPASFLLSGQSLTPYIENAKDIFVYYIDHLEVNFANKPIAHKVKLLTQLIDTIKLVESPLTQDLLLQQAANAYNIPFDSLKNALKKTTTNNTHNDHRETAPTYSLNSLPHSTPTMSSLEKKIFCGIMNNMEILRNHNTSYLIVYMPDPLKIILEKLSEYVTENSDIDFNSFFNALTPEEQSFTSQTLLSYDEQTLSMQDCAQLIVQLQRKHWKIIVQDIKKRIAIAEEVGDARTVATIMNDFLLLKRQILSTST